MEEQTPDTNQEPVSEEPQKERTEVYVLRDLKEYFGESLLIIFSVLLALFLTEFINNLHEKQQTKEMLSNIKAELIKNKQAEEEQYIYHKNVLKAIDSAIANPAFQQKLLTDGAFHFGMLVPHGVLLHDLSKVAWQVAQAHNITLKIDFKLTGQLTDIYDNQARIDKLEDGVAKVLLTYESREPKNMRVTLLLLKGTFKGWAFDRAPDLIKKYDEAIKAIDVD